MSAPKEKPRRAKLDAMKSPKAKPKLATITPAAEAVRSHLAATGDSLSGVREPGGLYWAFTASGLPVRTRDVSALRAAGMIESYGQPIDPGSASACYVLTTKGAKRSTTGETACGAKTIYDCTGPGLCVDCAPRGFYARMTPDDRARRWKGPKP